jgi:hypothetical protein
MPCPACRADITRVAVLDAIQRVLYDCRVIPITSDSIVSTDDTERLLTYCATAAREAAERDGGIACEAHRSAA